jgi:hypothetical protein
MVRFDLGDPRIIAASCGRGYPNEAHPSFVRALGLTPECLRTVRQEHTADVVTVDLSDAGWAPLPVADALATAAAGLPLGIYTADCVPVFIFDPVSKAVGLAHAGWKGLWKGVLENLVLAMVRNFGSHAENLRIAVGPCIRSCCYEVGEEFRKFFPDFYGIPDGKARAHVDLVAAAFRRLTDSGVPADSILDSGICTSCRNASFYSARCGDGPNRILSVLCRV